MSCGDLDDPRITLAGLLFEVHDGLTNRLGTKRTPNLAARYADERSGMSIPKTLSRPRYSLAHSSPCSSTSDATFG